MSEDTFYYWHKKLELDKPPDEKVIKVSGRRKIIRPAFFFLYRLFTEAFSPVEAFGFENIPKGKPCIIAPNHVSYLDYPTVVLDLPTEITDDLYVLSSAAYYDVAFVRFFMKWVANVVRVDIKDEFWGGLRAGAGILRLGKKLMLFPEGTRSKTGELGEFKTGAGVLSFECNVPIIPTYISGLEKVLPKGALSPKFNSRIRVSFGEPLYPDKFKQSSKEENAYYVYKEITEETKKRILELKESNK